METTPDPSSDDRAARAAADLREAERAAAAPYLSYPDLPWWWPPAAGAWFSAMLLALAWVNQDGSRAESMAAIVVLLAIELAFLGWLQRRHGAMPWPGFGSAPPEINRVWWAWIGGFAVILTVVALAWWQVGVVAAAVATLVLVTAGIAWYERAYRSAAAAVRERLP